MSHHFVTFSNVSYTYPNGQQALNGVSFTIHHGEKVAVVGPNGAGKSTLMRHFNGLLLPTGGDVNVGGIPVGKRTLSIIRKKVGLVFQNPDDQLFMPTVEDDVAFGPINMGLPPNEVERRIDMALSMVDSLHLRKRASHHLSGGEMRSVAIASVLAMEPEILVLDEPSSSLDPYSRRLLIKQIAKFLHTCVITTHDLNLAWELCTRTIVIKDGAVMADGATKEIFSDEKLLETCSLERPTLAIIEELRQ